MHTKTKKAIKVLLRKEAKKAKSFYAKESKQKIFLAKKNISIDLQQRTKRRACQTSISGLHKRKEIRKKKTKKKLDTTTKTKVKIYS